jgi:voltage-gated potassium channel Kch
VVVLWNADAGLSRAVEGLGAVFVGASPETDEGLERASVRHAVAIIALSADDRLNLHAALRARDANPDIRIVLRQFNRTLASKVEQNLTDCSVLSLAWHSAATYAAAAVDPSCFRALQFPEPDGPLTGFSTRAAEACGVAGRSPEEAERILGARVIAVGGTTEFAADRPLPAGARLTLFGEIARLEASVPHPIRPRTRRHRPQIPWRQLRRLVRRIDPIFARLAIAALATIAIGTAYFRYAFGSDWVTAIYFVITTMTTVGYGDLSPDRSNPAALLIAALLMLSGLAFSGIFIAFGAARLTRRQWISMQGLRRLHRQGHIVVCGAGSIGIGVIELLLGLGKRLVVIEVNPDPPLVELAREQRFDLMTGDASRDATLDLCNLADADGLVALTNVDTLNLEIALGARIRNATMPIVLRIADAPFAASIARHFGFETTFSAAGLAAPAFAGLSRFAGSRGRVAIGGMEFAIAEFGFADRAMASLAPRAIPLAVARADDFALARDYHGIGADDRLLLLVPLAAPGSEEAASAPATERIFGS